MTTSRREILAGAGAAALSALWACSGTSTGITPQPVPTTAKDTAYDVIVVGAGSAGIAAARAVQSAKRSVLVLEAMDHIGGRCHSDTTTFPIPFDYGAQFPGQATSLNNFLYPLMRQLGIKLIPGENVPRAFFNPKTGAEEFPVEFYATFGGVAAAIQTAGAGMTLGAPDASVLEVVTAAGLKNAPYVNLAYQFLMTVIDGGSAATQSTLDLYNVTQYVPAVFVYPPKDSFFIPSGYGAFIARLAKGLPIQTGTPVESIDYRSDRVSVKTATGKTYKAKAVIVTTSVNVIKGGGIKFEPGLPARHEAALSGITMGHATKAMLQFNGTPFDGKLNVQHGKMFTAVQLVNADAAQFIGNYFGEQFPNAGTYMMVIAEGELGIGLEKMGSAKAGKALCAQLEPAFPGVTAAWTGKILMSNWLTNPYTRGCISYATPGNAGARLALAKPIAKKVWFAGEALSVHSHSLVNGAWATGTDAAYAALFAIGALAKRRA